MGNIVRSLIDEFVPDWAARRAIQRTAEPQKEAEEIQMPVEVAVPHGRRDRGPYRPQPTPAHWRSPNM